MKETIGIFLLFFTFASLCLAQQNDSKTQDAQKVILKSGSQLSAKLQNKFDAETAKSGDDFVMTLTEELSGGGMSFAKGTELLGRVVRAKTVDGEDNTSEISVSFDYLKNGDDYLRFKAIILSGANGANKLDGVKFESSDIFKYATVISTKGKNLVIDEGLICLLKLEIDLMKP